MGQLHSQMSCWLFASMCISNQVSTKMEMGRLSNRKENGGGEDEEWEVGGEERRWWRPHISNSGILILICRAAPAHQLSSQTSGHPPPSSCHCHRKKKSFQVLLFLPSNTWVMKAERRRRKHVKCDCMDKASKASQLPQKSTCKALKMHIMS